MRPYVYILHSKKLSKFYIGQTQLDPNERLKQHNSAHYENSFTENGVPWSLYLSFKCQSLSQARKIEAHIKSMKSKTYILNLKKYPEIIEILKSRYFN